MVTSPTGKSIIVMGGWQPNVKSSRAMFVMGGSQLKPSKAIFELTDSMEWIQMEQTLQYDHFFPVAIPIPDDLVYEKDTNNEQK